MSMNIIIRHNEPTKKRQQLKTLPTNQVEKTKKENIFKTTQDKVKLVFNKPSWRRRWPEQQSSAPYNILCRVCIAPSFFFFISGKIIVNTCCRSHLNISKSFHDWYLGTIFMAFMVKCKNHGKFLFCTSWFDTCSSLRLSQPGLLRRFPGAVSWKHWVLRMSWTELGGTRILCIILTLNVIYVQLSTNL